LPYRSKPWRTKPYNLRKRLSIAKSEVALRSIATCLMDLEDTPEIWELWSQWLERSKESHSFDDSLWAWINVCKPLSEQFDPLGFLPWRDVVSASWAIKPSRRQAPWPYMSVWHVRDQRDSPPVEWLSTGLPLPLGDEEALGD